MAQLFNVSSSLNFRHYVVSRPSRTRQNFVCLRPQSAGDSPRKFMLKANAVVSGDLPDAPPVPPKPSGPPGTPNARPLSLVRRPRCLRGSAALRVAVQETHLSASNLVYPIFIHEGEEDIRIEALPGRCRLGWRHGLVKEVSKALAVGVNQVLLFPKIPDALKSPSGDEAYNENGLVPRSIRLLRHKYPELVIYSDVTLSQYTSDRHDGIVREDGAIMNDETVHQLCKQAITQARAGVDVISPNDMMDGRVGAIHEALDAEGFHDVKIMSYTAKYASAFYGPFRKAHDADTCFGDKRTYQINPANYIEALVELHADESEGVDILLVKPGLPYLDIIRLFRDNSNLPVAACQVSGEYAMIKAAGALKIIDEEKVMMESLMCLRRGGANIIITYFALQAATCLAREIK